MRRPTRAQRPLAHHSAELPASLAGDRRHHRDIHRRRPAAHDSRGFWARPSTRRTASASRRLGAEQALWTTALILLAVSVARGIFTLIQNYYSEAVGHHAAYELRLACYEKLQRLSFSFHDKVHSGDLIMLGIIDIDGIRMFFATATVRVVPPRRPDRRRRLPPAFDRPGPWASRAEFRALRRLALVGLPAQAARHLADAPGAAPDALARHGGEPRRHPRRPRLRRPAP